MRAYFIKQERLEFSKKERGFRLRVRRTQGGRFDKQTWPEVTETLNKGDVYVEN